LRAKNDHEVTRPVTSALPPSNEQALIEASRAGDSAALEELVRFHQTRVYNFAVRMCRNIEDAKDILQETFLGVLRSIRDFRAESRFTTWLYRIASNACLKKRRRGVHDPEPEQEEHRHTNRGGTMNWGGEVWTVVAVLGIWVVLQIILRKAGVPT